jgi:hypothetical protein
LNFMVTSFDSWTGLKVAAVLIPAAVFLWSVMTVMALHRRDVHFWSLGSTWTTIVGCPAGIIIASFSGWSGLHDPNAAPFYTLTFAGVALYAVACAFSLFYNFNATKSVTLAVSTTILQQFAVIGVPPVERGSSEPSPTRLMATGVRAHAQPDARLMIEDPCPRQGIPRRNRALDTGIVGGCEQ